MAEKQSVTLTIVPSRVSALQAVSPSQVSGTLIAMLGAILESFIPSAIISLASVATTSAETGPETMSQISFVTSRMSRPAFRMSEGLVVTPSTMPRSLSSRMAAVSAVSTKNFMAGILSLAAGAAGAFGRASSANADRPEPRRGDRA